MESDIDPRKRKIDFTRANSLDLYVTTLRSGWPTRRTIVGVNDVQSSASEHFLALFSKKVTTADRAAFAAQLDREPAGSASMASPYAIPEGYTGNPFVYLKGVAAKIIAPSTPTPGFRWRLVALMCLMI